MLETSTNEDVKLDDILPKLMSVEQRLSGTEWPVSSDAAMVAAAKRRDGFKQLLASVWRNAPAMLAVGSDTLLATAPRDVAAGALADRRTALCCELLPCGAWCIRTAAR